MVGDEIVIVCLVCCMLNWGGGQRADGGFTPECWGVTEVKS